MVLMEEMSKSRNCCGVNLPLIAVDVNVSSSLDGDWVEFEQEVGEAFLFLRLRRRFLGEVRGGGKLRGQV